MFVFNLNPQPLLANGVYNQPTQDRFNPGTPIDWVRGRVWTDQPGTLALLESHDGNTWTQTASIPVSASTYTELPWTSLSKRYYAFQYTNGATAQTVFKLYQQTAAAEENALTQLTGSNALIGNYSLTWAASAAAGTAQTASVTLPAPLQGDALYLVSIMNPTGTPQGLSASLSSTASAGSYLAASTTYYYAVTAVGPWGETRPCPSVSIAEGTTAYEVNLSWSSPGGATSYNVYKGTASGAVYLLASVSGTSYTDTGATATTSTAPPTSSFQGPGSSITVNFADSVNFGLSNTYESIVTSVDVAVGSVKSYLVQGWLLGDSTAEIIATNDSSASNPSGSIYLQVRKV